jgi:hypothetical protein
MIEKWIEEFEDLWLGDFCEYYDCWDWCKEQNEELFLQAEQECKKVFKYNYTEILESDDPDYEEYDSYDRYNAIRFTLDYFWDYYGYELDYEYGLYKKGENPYE